MQKLLNLSEKISKYLIAATLIIVPLFPKFPLIRVSGTYVAIRFEDLLLLLLAVSLLPKAILDGKKLLHDKIIIAFLIFLGSGLLSLFAGSLLTQSESLVLGIFHWARRIEYIVPFLAAYLLIPKEKISENVLYFLKILIIVTIVAFIYGFGQRYFSFPIIITQNEQYSKGIALLWTPGSHINSTFAGHYDLAAFVVLLMPIFLPLLFVVREKMSKLWLFIASGTGLWLLINSLSRTSQVSYLVASSISLFLVKKYKALVAVVALSIILMAVSSGLDARFEKAIQVIYQRVTAGKTITYVREHFVALADEVTLPDTASVTQLPSPSPVPVLSDVSIAIRVNVEWPRALRAFLKNPLLGTGYSSIDLATDNDYLRILGETGLLGLASFFLMLATIGKVFWKAFPFNKKLSGVELCFVVGVVGATVGTLITAFFIDLFEASKFAIIFWLILGCAVNLIKNKYNVE